MNQPPAPPLAPLPRAPQLRCRTGRHVWTDPQDAARCCDPAYARILRVGGGGGRPLWFAHVWVRVDDLPEAPPL